MTRVGRCSCYNQKRVWFHAQNLDEYSFTTITSRRPPKARMRPMIRSTEPRKNPINAEAPVITAPAIPAPTAVAAWLSEVAIISLAVRPDSRRVDSGRRKTQTPNSKNPRPNARRIVGARMPKIAPSATTAPVQAGEGGLPTVPNDAIAGASASALATPKITPTHALKIIRRNFIPSPQYCRPAAILPPFHVIHKR